MASTVASSQTEKLAKPSAGQSPKITRKLRGKRTTAGKTVILSCAANVNEDTNITWFKNGAKLEAPLVTTQSEELRHRIYSKIDQDEIELVITNVNRNDAGYYLCVASNSLGEASSMAELSVKAW